MLPKVLPPAFCDAPLNKELRHREALTTMAWLVQPFPSVEPDFLAATLAREFGLNSDDFTISHHYPKDFWINFFH
ncbi:hypothetical protein GUJ93_ZPchr0009g240 [Zizania palustris]|uniref:Uncharacterized protein n=1 Tax=Zizania palustris TaxID=103762 RepID=A0A8J5RLL1_ZIZPA|nr:hypothetical protein GUJ93_ZPchr0009g240 [Zizania palustris]